MAELMDIPDEILEHILTHVSDIAHSSLSNIALTNKRLSKIASPLQVRRWSNDRISEERHDYKDAPIARLALRLLRYPRLRTRVRSLKFGHLKVATSYQPPKDLRPDNLEALSWAAKEAIPALTESTDLCEQIRQGWEDAIVVLVLAWSTKLTRLDLRLPYFDPKPGVYDLSLIELFLKQSVVQLRTGVMNAQPLTLGELTYLSIHWDDPRISNEVEFLTPLFYLPKLKHLAADRIKEEGYDSEDEENDVLSTIHQNLIPWPASTSTIESIELSKTTILTDVLSKMLGACRSLKALKLDVMDDLGEFDFSRKAFAQIILHHATTLEELDISFNSLYLEDFDEQSSDKGVALEDCYQYLTNLKTLGIDMVNLFEVPRSEDTTKTMIISRLPDCTEWLKLYCWSFDLRWERHCQEAPDFIEAITALLSETGPLGRFRNLKIISIELPSREALPMEDVYRTVALAKARGVELFL